jgi:anti-sigma B factor antagonist
MTPEGTHRSLTVKSECVDDKCIVYCTGDLVDAGCALLHQSVMELLPQYKIIVLDLAQLVWIDSMGIGTLVRLQVACKAAGSKLQLINVRKQITEVLTITNLLGIFA